MSNELFKTIEAQGRLITELRAEQESREVYAVHVLDSLLDYCQTELFAKYEDAQEAYEDYLAVHHNYIKHIHSQVICGGEGSHLEFPHLYYEGEESNIKISIEKIQIK
tara:strand:+ start:8029 stop:8352 length:324 start_codon:yes stop_codon:yes gene_type:complete